MRTATAAAPPFFKNGYVVSCETTREAILIDPGDEVDSLLYVIRHEHLDVRAILLTHAHLDHITGVGRAKTALHAPIWLHEDDLFLYEGAEDQGRMFGLKVDPLPTVDRFYEPNQQFRFGQYRVDVLPTPGHCPGGVCLAIGLADSTARELFVGDTLFAGFDWPHRSAWRRPRDADQIDSDGAVRVSRRHHRAFRSRTRHDDWGRAADKSVSVRAHHEG